MTRGNGVTIRLRQLDILRKVLKIIDALLEREDFQALDCQIRVRVRKTKEAVFKHDRCAVVLLRDHTIDRRIG